MLFSSIIIPNEVNSHSTFSSFSCKQTEHVSVPQIFDRMKFVALWSAKKKRTTKGYGSAAINQHDIFVLPDGFIEK